MIEAMIDIEAFDLDAEAVVFQVGLVLFEGADIITKRSWNADVQMQLDQGRTVSAYVLEFWLDPAISAVAHKALKDKGALQITQVLEELHLILHRHTVEQIWAKGLYDFKVLEHICKAHKGYTLSVPWEYTAPRDLRTMMKECGVTKQAVVSHNALDDCINQHSQLMKCREKIRDSAQLMSIWEATTDYRLAQRDEGFAAEHDGVDVLATALDKALSDYEDEPSGAA